MNQKTPKQRVKTPYFSPLAEEGQTKLGFFVDTYFSPRSRIKIKTKDKQEQHLQQELVFPVQCNIVQYATIANETNDIFPRVQA